jgi:Spore germination protein
VRRNVLIGFVIGAVLVGAGVSLIFNRPPDPPPPIALETTPPTEVSATVTLYWLNSQGDRLVAVKRTIKEKATSLVLVLALQSLIKEPPPDNLYSAIPKDTEILDLQVDGQDIRLNLSSAFGRGGGATAIQGRLIQVLYTLTSLEPTARVFLSIEGKPVTYLGGEGIEVKQPMTRQDYPEIL